MTYEEFPVFVPMGDERLCSVITAPAGEGHDLGAVLLTGGNYTRIHRNGMWVRAARAVADLGVPSIRVDYHGIGDSTGTATFHMEAPFDDDAIAAANFLQRATGVRRLAVVATCFGGRSAMAAAARHPDVVALTIFPVPLLIPAGQGPLPLRTRVKRLIRRSAIGEALLDRPSIQRVRTAAAYRRDKPAQIVSPRFKKDLMSFVRRGSVRFVYGGQEDSTEELERCLAEVEPKLSAEERGRITVDVVPDIELHRFQRFVEQDIVIDRAVRSVADALTAQPAAARS